MAIEALIERHWDELLSLRDDCLAQMLSTKPADREKLEQAIADIYELAGMKLPAQVIWFDSQIDARLCIAMWIFMLDPFVHALFVTDPIFDFDFDECSIRVPSEIATANDAVAWVRIQSQFLKPV